MAKLSKNFALLFANLMLCAGLSFAAPVRVEGVGNTVEQAKEAAFRKAIENQLGVLVLSDREIQDQKQLKNEILSYSAGYVDSYSVVSQDTFRGRVRLVLDVEVSSSKLLNRAAPNAPNKPLDGQSIAGSISSFTNQRQQTDKLAAKILDGFPRNAITVTVKKNEVSFDQNRNPSIQFTTELTWNRDYISALREMLQLTSDNRGDAGSFKLTFKEKPDDWMAVTELYKFGDDVLFYKMLTRFTTLSVSIRTTMKAGAEVIYDRCFPVKEDFLPRNFLYNDVIVDGREKYSVVFSVGIRNGSNLHKALENVTDVSLSAEHPESCPKAPIVNNPKPKMEERHERGSVRLSL